MKNYTIVPSTPTLKLVIVLAAFAALSLWFAGCAFDKLRFSVDNGTLYQNQPSVVPSVTN